MRNFTEKLKENELYVGDIVEFGTGSGETTVDLALHVSPHTKIFTFDGFKGLPKTNKCIPMYSGWHEGGMLFDEEKTKNRFQNFPNIYSIKSMFCDLKDPSNYGISKIAGVHIDVDIYESAVDALNFVDKCDWNHILVRFDDWGAHPHQIKEEVDAHEKAAFYEFIEKNNYKYQFYEDYLKATGYLVCIVRISR